MSVKCYSKVRIYKKNPKKVRKKRKKPALDQENDQEEKKVFFFLITLSFLLFFFVAFLVKSVFHCFLTFLFFTSVLKVHCFLEKKIDELETTRSPPTTSATCRSDGNHSFNLYPRKHVAIKVGERTAALYMFRLLRKYCRV